MVLIYDAWIANKVSLLNALTYQHLFRKKQLPGVFIMGSRYFPINKYVGVVSSGSIYLRWLLFRRVKPAHFSTTYTYHNTYFFHIMYIMWKLTVLPLLTMKLFQYIAYILISILKKLLVDRKSLFYN